MTSRPPPLPRCQHGISLLMSLVMLVLLMALAVSVATLTTSSTRIVGNTQNRALAVATAQRGIEEVLGDIASFTSPTAPVAVTPPSGMTLTVATRECINSTPAAGYSALQPIVPEDTFWRVRVDVTDSVTGAATSMEQGVRIRMLSGSCI